ncbi:D-hexose-6-phosphate mutarotase [Shewanella avicenniae]|uniref:Putative glucose-6-phosphate 1-epimerase n=1 Tax=Shewanella avicenniae TaxID=2814294 RepID=A0ABX7QVY0_9GAMM|nr:D-hexose-6-phosphate mutarotase [Shewanella avicenniae]QSX34993.1 D-hexose-6-phosphate mutarotase [Shewanella avicenniae]
MASIRQLMHTNGLEYLQINSALCEARIFLQGAQVEYFAPTGKAPLLWVSSADEYKPGTGGIRGGIPVCWPWFGNHANADWPAHGFARNKMWDWVGTDVENEVVTLRFSLPAAQFERQYWPHNSSVMLEVVLSDTLTVKLINQNLGDTPFTLTQALHSYFPIGDIHQLQASGFAGSKYIEFGEGPFIQQGDSVEFTRETDRVYTALSPVQQLQTVNGTIEVSRENSQSAVLWNPWIEKSQRLSRFNDDDYLQMACLEAANVLEDAVTLAPGESHTLSTRIRWVD